MSSSFLRAGLLGEKKLVEHGMGKPRFFQWLFSFSSGSLSSGPDALWLEFLDRELVSVGSSPLGLPAVRAWAPDRPAPLDGAGGGDLLAAVEAVASVPGVRVLQILGHQLHAVGAAGHLVGFFGVDGVGRLVAAEGPVAGPVVDDVLLRRIHRRRFVPVVAVVKVFRSVIEPPPRVSEGQLRVREQGVEIIAVGHCSEPLRLYRHESLSHRVYRQQGVFQRDHSQQAGFHSPLRMSPASRRSGPPALRLSSLCPLGPCFRRPVSTGLSVSPALPASAAVLWARP